MNCGARFWEKGTPIERSSMSFAGYSIPVPRESQFTLHGPI